MTDATPIDGEAEPISLKQALETRYLAYALSTITNRALPDVRDGLKPVHRRLLYAMRQLHLDPEQGFKKSARVVGDVIGRYHPHGDQAVYALVRWRKTFSCATRWWTAGQFAMWTAIMRGHALHRAHDGDCRVAVAGH